MTNRVWFRRSLRVRVPATVVSVFAISLAVAVFVGYELLLQDGRRDADVVLAREEERFARSLTELLEEVELDQPDLEPDAALRRAVRRYLQLNPSTDSYLTIVTFRDGTQLAAANGPPELELLLDDGGIPQGALNRRETLSTPVGEIRTTSVPVAIDGERVARLAVVIPLAPVRTEALEAAGLIAVAAGLALLVGGALLGVSLWRSLAPLGALADAARGTEPGSLGARVEAPATDDEVGVLSREFNRMLERLERASAQQHEFMATVGHELRTPITIARGHLELLRTSDPSDADHDDTVAIVSDELTRMSRLVEDLMAIARAEMTDFVRPRRMDLVAWFEDLELRVAGTDAGRATRIVPPPPVEVTVDPDRLAQAVLNLVDNAHLHTPDGTSVRVYAEKQGSWLILAVDDDGTGIAPEVVNDVFAPFVTAGTAPGSLGLGLAVVRAVVEAHGGRVTVTSSPTGSSFRLWLPLQDAASNEATAELPTTVPGDV